MPDPRPAELPLPGGREGARVRVHPLKVAEESAPPQFWDGAASRTKFLQAVVTPRSQWVLLPMPALELWARWCRKATTLRSLHEPTLLCHSTGKLPFLSLVIEVSFTQQIPPRDCGAVLRDDILRYRRLATRATNTAETPNAYAQRRRRAGPK